MLISSPERLEGGLEEMIDTPSRGSNPSATDLPVERPSDELSGHRDNGPAVLRLADSITLGMIRPKHVPAHANALLLIATHDFPP